LRYANRDMKILEDLEKLVKATEKMAKVTEEEKRKRDLINKELGRSVGY